MLDNKQNENIFFIKCLLKTDYLLDISVTNIIIK